MLRFALSKESEDCAESGVPRRKAAVNERDKSFLRNYILAFSQSQHRERCNSYGELSANRLSDYESRKDRQTIIALRF